MNYRNLILVGLLIVAGPITPMSYLRGQATTQPASAPATRSAEIKPPAPPAPAGPQTTSQTRWPVSKSPVHEVVLGSNDKPTDGSPGFKLQVRLTSLGAAVKTAKLTDYFATVADKRRCEREKNHAAYLQAVEKDSELQGHYSLLNPVITGDRTFYPLATRRITVIAGVERIPLDLSGPRWTAGEVQTEKNEKNEVQNQSVTFSARIYRNDEPFLLLRKTYTLRTGSYSVLVDLEVVNLDKTGKAEFSLMQFSTTGLSMEDVRSDDRTLAYGRYEGGKVKIDAISSRDLGKMKTGLADVREVGRSDTAEPVLWTGQTNKFFAALTYIVPKDSEKLTAPQSQAAFFGAALEETGRPRTSLAGINLGPYELNGGGSTDVRLDLFAGPKKRDLFDDTPLYRNLDYKGTLQTGACFCAFQPLTLGMMWLLDFFSGYVTLGNYGLAIILLVMLVRICLHPLMKKQQVSMMRMQKLAPEMEKVKKKYANDKAKLNAEMMKVYKAQGATPLLGCLPMLLQMPILIALWTSINASVELRHAAFLPVWIIDLAAPDALISFGGGGLNIPLVGSMIGTITGFNLLPLLLCVVMYFQMKTNPQMGASTTPQQASSQTMMKYMMPGMMLVFFYNAPSGLNLYFMTSTFAGLAEQYVIRKHIREKEAAEAAAETTVAMPGKYFRGQKPKKPKGPFQIKG